MTFNEEFKRIRCSFGSRTSTEQGLEQRFRLEVAYFHPRSHKETSDEAFHPKVQGRQLV